MKKHPLPQTALALLAVLAFALPAGPLAAAASADAKARMLESAYKARDNGDLATAKKNFEALLKDSPDNADLKQQLAAVNAKIAAETEAKTAKVAAEKADKDAKAAAAKAEKEAKAKAEQEAKVAAAAERKEQERINTIASDARKAAKAKADAGNFEAADTVFADAIKAIGSAPAAQPLAASLQEAKTDLLAQKVEFLLKSNKMDEAKKAYQVVAPGSARAAQLQDAILNAELHPPLPGKFEVSAPYFAGAKDVAQLVAQGKAQYNAGDYVAAEQTFTKVMGADGLNREAPYFLELIGQKFNSAAVLARETMADRMLRSVTDQWAPPSVNVGQNKPQGKITVDTKDMENRLEAIKIPEVVSFNEANVDDVVAALINLARKYEKLDSNEWNKGKGPLNFVHRKDSKAKVATVKLSLEGESMRVLIEQINRQISYEATPDGNIVVLHPGDSGAQTAGMVTEIFPISLPTKARILGASAASGGPAAGADPFSAPAADAAPAATGESGSIKSFLENTGVSWGLGTSLIYDGAAIIVIQTPRMIEKIRDVLSRYNDVKQVTIETKFLEVTQGDLREVGFNWGGAQIDANGSATNKIRGRDAIRTPNRSIADTFTVGSGTSNQGLLIAAGATTTQSVNVRNPDGSILTTSTGAPVTETVTIPGTPTILPIINNPPDFPGVADFATGVTTQLANLSHRIGNFDVNAVIRALDRKRGTELLSAPSVTVLSGNPASIAVGQELRYPQSYSDARVTTGGGGTSGSGGSVAIASGTPQDFQVRKIGVELKVTPTVEEDNYSISLELAPIVTEFEGFVEYGGPNVAIVSGSSLSAPSGFFQPVFSVREITTHVEIWDGATLVMGGLTREDVRKVNDKVPLLGDIPLIGRLFQSKGETSEKRNLLIFVTANLVGPGGAPTKQDTVNVKHNSKFVSPTVMMPSGSESRRLSPTDDSAAK